MKYTVKYKCVMREDCLVFRTLPLLIVKFKPEDTMLYKTAYEDFDYHAFKRWRSYYIHNDVSGALKDASWDIRVKVFYDILKREYGGDFDKYILEYARYLILEEIIEQENTADYEKAMERLLINKWRSHALEIEYRSETENE